MKTRGIVIVEPFKVELREVELPEPLPHEVVVRTLFSGISVGTERHYITGVYAEMGKNVAANYPFVTGYQRSGVVEAVGGAVDGLAAGDLVIMGRSRLADPRLKGGPATSAWGSSTPGRSTSSRRARTPRRRRCG